MYYAAGRGGGSSEEGSSSVWSVEVVVVVVGSDMDSVEKGKKKYEEMGNLGTCFQGNRGLKNTGRLDFLFSTLHCPLATYCRHL